MMFLFLLSFNYLCIVNMALNIATFMYVHLNYHGLQQKIGDGLLQQFSYKNLNQSPLCTVKTYV